MKATGDLVSTSVRGVMSLCFVFLAALALIQCASPLSNEVTEPVQPSAAVLEKIPTTGTMQANGSVYFYSVPPLQEWKDLVVYAHGYYAQGETWEPGNDKVEDTPISQIVNDLGFAYASTSYPYSGLVVPAAVIDVETLVSWFVSQVHRAPRYVYLVGPSEGGLITTLAIERNSGVFSGGMAMCGPVGDFRKQMDYFGDFHVIFNYFLPGVVPGSPAGISPDPSVGNWESVYKPPIVAAVRSKPGNVDQVLRVTRAATDLFDPSTKEKTVLDVLWYNLFATNDAIARLGGKPYDNRMRIYTGSSNDLKLNLTVPRYKADAAALFTISTSFQTSGVLRRPLVNLHTTGDPIIPYWHASLYGLKVLARGSALQYVHLPILRYGHCQFKTYEVLAGFAVLVLKVSLQDLIVAEKVLPQPEQQSKFLELARGQGAHPRIVAKATATAAVQ